MEQGSYKRDNLGNLAGYHIARMCKPFVAILANSEATYCHTYEVKKDLGIRFERALATFRSKERQIFLEIKQQIISLVLKRTVVRAQETFGPKERATALINDTINKLEGDLL